MPPSSFLDKTLGARCEIQLRLKEDLLEIKSDPLKRGFSKTVLVVDDHEQIRKMLATAFLFDGFKKCGEAALSVS